MSHQGLDDIFQELGLPQYIPKFQAWGITSLHMMSALSEDDWIRLVPDSAHRATLQLSCQNLLHQGGTPHPGGEETPLLEVGRGFTPPKCRARVSDPDPPKEIQPRRSDNLVPICRTPSSRSLARHRHEVQTDIPGRLDRLPWCGWHWAVTLALGFAWILDGFLVSLNSLVGPKLTEAATMGISTLESATIGAVYIAGAVAGAILFGYLSDRYGRRRLFVIIPLVYLSASAAASTAHTYAHFVGSMFVMGLGIGGEYSALTSALNELIPARVRGTVDLVINGSYWLGACLAALASKPLFDEAIIGADVGWRVAYVLTTVLGVFILCLRLYLPESPRWLVMHGRQEEAEAVMQDIENKVMRWTGKDLPDATHTVTVKVGFQIGQLHLLRVLFWEHPDLSFLSFVLMVSQAFFYNAIYFTYISVLHTFQDVSTSQGGDYLIPFTIGNFLGSALLGRFFDVVGRKPMMIGTYTLSALMLGGMMLLFYYDLLTAVTQTLCFSAVFFVASAAASSAMLTVSEIFTLEVRARAISVFWGLGTAAGGISGPLLFGYLIEQSEHTKCKGPILFGYGIGAGLMLIAAIVDAWLGVECKGQTLEHINSECHDLSAEG